MGMHGCRWRQLLLVATRCRVSLTLPTGDDVNTVTEAQWVRIPLRDPSASLSKAEARNAASLQETCTEVRVPVCAEANPLDPHWQFKVI